MMRFRALAATLLLLAAATSLTPTAAAIQCDRVDTLDDIQKCQNDAHAAAVRLVNLAVDEAQRIVGGVLYEVCHFTDPQRCP